MKRPATTKPRWVREARLPNNEELAWLQSEEGRAVCRAMAENAPADTPPAIERWRKRICPPLVSAAWTQVLLRRAAKIKFSRADDMLFDRVGLEQSTDEVIATHKAGRFAGLGRIADLCCGIGGDAIALADSREVVAVDACATRTVMVGHNVGVYGRRITARTGDANVDWPDADAAHIDPDRRPAGRRRYGAGEGSPSLDGLKRIVDHYASVAIKLAPGADFDELPFAAEIELISHHSECRQAVAWTGKLRTAHRRATVLPAGESLAISGDEPCEWPIAQPPEPGCFLYEPDPAVIRADLVGVLARQLGLAPIDPHIAWLIGNQAPTSPFIHAFKVVDVIGFSAKPARKWLAGHDIGPLEIKTRGFAVTPETILKQLRPTGKRHAVLFLTRLGERPTAILAERRP